MPKHDAWKSSYENVLKDNVKVVPFVKPPGPDSLPDDRWVKPNKEAYKVMKTEVIPWLREQGLKYRVCQIAINYTMYDVFLFKKAKHAVLFKLTWG